MAASSVVCFDRQTESHGGQECLHFQGRRQTHDKKQSDEKTASFRRFCSLGMIDTVMLSTRKPMPWLTDMMRKLSGTDI